MAGTNILDLVASAVKPRKKDPYGTPGYGRFVTALEGINTPREYFGDRARFRAPVVPDSPPDSEADDDVGDAGAEAAWGPDSGPAWGPDSGPASDPGPDSGLDSGPDSGPDSDPGDGIWARTRRGRDAGPLRSGKTRRRPFASPYSRPSRGAKRRPRTALDWQTD